MGGEAFIGTLLDMMNAIRTTFLGRLVFNCHGLTKGHLRVVQRVLSWFHLHFCHGEQKIWRLLNMFNHTISNV